MTGFWADVHKQLMSVHGVHSVSHSGLVITPEPALFAEEDFLDAFESSQLFIIITRLC